MGMDPSVGALGSQAMAESIQSGMNTTPTGGTGEAPATFNGTIGDLKEKYPEAYQKLVLEQLAYRIVDEVKRDNERFIETIKKNQR